MLVANLLLLGDCVVHSVYLDECTDDSQGGEPQILKRTSLADSVEEGVEVEGDVGWREIKGSGGYNRVRDEEGVG